MKITHPDGDRDIVLAAGTRFVAEIERKDSDLPGWIAISYIGDGAGILVDHDQWPAFMALVKEIDEAKQ